MDRRDDMFELIGPLFAVRRNFCMLYLAAQTAVTIHPAAGSILHIQLMGKVCETILKKLDTFEVSRASVDHLICAVARV